MQRINIKAGSSDIQYWKDLYKYRELFYFLAWRDILIRYKQTVVGVAWAVLRPFLTMIILTFVFSKVAKLPSAGIPYPILVFSAMLPWQFFATALTESSRSLVSSAQLVSKIYFPRLVIPTSAVITSFVDFIVSAIILAGMMVYYDYMPGPRVFLLPLFISLSFGFALGSGIWISALMVNYRDFRIIVPFIVQFGLYASPVGYSSASVPEEYAFLYELNPMVSVIDGFRWAILGGENMIHWSAIVYAAFTTVATMTTGIMFFRRTERTFADHI